MDLKNYKLIKKEYIKELSTTGYYFEHSKTKAKVVYLSNDDDNKTFFIGFRTPAPDDTGVPHILEHSVLCGSKKFPIKDPFMELVKGSLQTFLNAMTYPDKTVYPVSSRNDKDFKNLMNVYLDAVLYPRIYTQPEILKQEGWHYQLDKPEDEPTISGVVYNEMKGAFSSPESVLYRDILHQMFPETSYKNESGGIPEFIPKLTQENFTNFHKRYYHPSNSFIFIYGNGNIEEHLNYIDKEYLCDFEYSPPNSEIKIQKTFEKMIESTSYYPISKEDSVDEKTYLSLSFAIGQSSDPVNTTTMDMLSYILLDSEAAPLKKALLDAGIGKDVYGSSETDVQQPVFSIFSKNANSSQKGKFKKIVFKTLEDLVKNGIDKDLIKGAINTKEFAMREADFGGFPKGLFYGLGYVMPSWLYDEDPFKYLHYEKTLSEIKNALTEPYFENFIEKNILSNNHSCLLMLEPKQGMNDENQEKLQKKLSEYKKSLSKKEIEDLIQDNKSLVAFQTAPDLLENLEKLPMLERSDIKKQIEILPQNKLNVNETETYHHDINTNGILYETLFFSMKHLKKEDLKWAGLLLDVIGKMNTKNYSYGDLDNQINIHTGGVGYSSSIIPLVEDAKKYYCFATISTKVLTKKVSIANALILEVIQGTDFSDKKRILEIVQEIRSRIEMNLMNSGHAITMNRLQSYWSPTAYLSEELGGISYYLFIKEIEKTFNQESDVVVKKLSYVLNLLFSVKPALVSVTCDGSLKEEWEQNYNVLCKKFNSIRPSETNWDFPLERKNEGFITPGNVQYVSKGFDYKSLGFSYNGQLNVLRTVVSHNYLYENVRVLGGAYGAFSVFRNSGAALFSSYRDPNLLKTIAIYDKAWDYLSSFNESEKNMTKYIIGTIGSMDFPMTPSVKGAKATINALAGITDEFRQNEREQVLQTSKDDIRNYQNMVHKVTDKNTICVMGSEKAIKDNKEVFKSVIKLM
ncbi:MAG: insulinase family protein [Caldisericia bacterium]|nr:insulinase family protein [Caldisericia bacterium]